MSDNPTGTESTEGQTQTPAVTEKPLEQAGKVFDEAYVKSLRDEAADARVSKRDAVEAARTEVKTEYEGKLAEASVAYTELENLLAAKDLELQKVYAAIAVEVPSDKVRAFAEILKGEDEESIAESAKTNLQLFGGFNSKSPAFDPTQGTGGRKELPLNGDPILNAIKQAVGIK